VKVLVTGGAGYIGSHTVKLLRRAGHQPVIFDNFSTGKRVLAQAAEVIEADLADGPALGAAFRHHRFEAVLHFASLIQVGESYADPQKYYRHNLVNSLNLLEAMLAAGVKKLVFSSSAAVYGLPRRIPVTEDHPLEPANPYGQTKYFLEKILQEFDRAYGLRSISLRYFNAAGADPEGELGEMHEPETHLIPNILNFLLGRTDKLEIYGTDFETPDGTAVRDYIHVNDLAQAHLQALELLASEDRSEAINLGTNRAYSVREVIKKTEEVTGRKVTFFCRPRRQGDVPVLRASKDKAEAMLGWKLHHSELETILRTAWAWHRKFVR
jgi:UDP-glucose-4-epimerase GalE